MQNASGTFVTSQALAFATKLLVCIVGANNYQSLSQASAVSGQLLSTAPAPGSLTLAVVPSSSANASSGWGVSGGADYLQQPASSSQEHQYVQQQTQLSEVLDLTLHQAPMPAHLSTHYVQQQRAQPTIDLSRTPEDLYLVQLKTKQLQDLYHKFRCEQMCQEGPPGREMLELESELAQYWTARSIAVHKSLRVAHATITEGDTVML